MALTQSSLIYCFLAADEWAKDITTTNGNFRGKMPAVRQPRGHQRFAGHPYAPRGARR